MHRWVVLISAALLSLSALAAEYPAYRYLDTTGDGTGTKNASVDGSVTPVAFKLAPASGESFVLERMLVTVRDTGTFDAATYGNGVGLTNGLTVGIYRKSDDGLVYDLLDGLPVKTNTDWGRLCYDVDLKTWGTGDEVLLSRWTFAKAGSPLVITDSEYLAVTVRDNLTGLVEHWFQVQGTRH